MPACPGGSSALPQAPFFFFYDLPYIALKLGPVWGYFGSLLLGLPPEPQITADFCAQPQPTDLPTIDDYLNIGNPTLALTNGTFQRFGNLVKAAKWADLCQCNATDPGVCYSLFGGGAPAWSQSTFHGATIYPGNRFTALVNGQCTGGRWYVPFGTNPGTPVSLWEVASGVKIAEMTIAPLANSGFYDFEFAATPPSVLAGQDYVMSYVLANNSEYLWEAGTSIPFSNSFMAGVAPAAGTSAVVIPSANPGNYYGIEPVICQGDPGTAADPPVLVPPPPGFPMPPASPTCLSLQEVCDALLALRRDVGSISTLVTLVQRQAVPFGYIPGAVHAGLTGIGEFAVQGILGLRVELTAVPDYLGLRAGDPETIFDAGWINLGTADGWLPRARLHHAEMIILPPAAGVHTRVGYSLEPNVEITVTELVREH